MDMLQPRTGGRRAGTRVLSDEAEQLIENTIREVYLKPTRPTLTHLVHEVHARCTEKNLPLPHRRTVQARVKAIDAHVRGLKRGEAAIIKATTETPGEYTVNRPLEMVQINHTEINVIVVDEQTREPPSSRPWLTLAIDAFSRMVTGFHVSMSAPSRVSVGLCLLHSVFGKPPWLSERTSPRWS
jgi:putative transposase